MAKAWSGRFSGETDPRVELFTESISFDHRLAEFDVAGSKAHAAMLAKVGLLTADEAAQIAEALDDILAEIRAGHLEFRTELEDIHMHIESALIERLGDVGRKLHTARSRNDQVSTDLRLWTRAAIDELVGLIHELQSAFVGRCDADANVIIPGYTHLQRAQPVHAAHYWLAWCEKLERDRGRLLDCRARANVSPLGGAALAGTSLPIDREFTAAELGFDGVAANSLDISSDRDFLFEFCSALSLLATHLSSWAEEWIIWFSTEFGFLRLPDAYTTGSSIMPQKRNPDVLELIRGKSARVMASASQMLLLLKNLPMAYNRDLQEDKLPAFDAFDQTRACLDLAAAIVAGAELNADRIAERIDDGFLDATALMEHLIQKQVPMRTAHETVGRLVSLCEQQGCRLAELSLEQLQQACPALDDSVYDVLGAENAARVLQSFGSGGAQPVAEQIAIWKQRIGERP